MKVLLLVNFVCLAFCQGNWESWWTVLVKCGANCCCPSETVYISPDPHNTSELLMTGTWNGDSVCATFNLTNNTAWSLPWISNNTNFLTNPVYDKYGFEYIGSVQSVGKNSLSLIVINQVSQGGSASCKVTFSNKTKIES